MIEGPMSGSGKRKAVTRIIRPARFLADDVRGFGFENAGKLGALAAAEVIQHIGARPQVSLKELAKQRGLPV